MVLIIDLLNNLRNFYWMDRNMKMYVVYVWLNQQMEIMNNVEILLNYYINKKQHNRNE